MIATIERELGGEAIFDWRQGGLCCTLSVPRADVFDRRPMQRSNGNGHALTADSLPADGHANGRRVLLVEDEALVAIMMRDMLNDLGFSVLGPMSNTSSALAAAKKAEFDCAILDLNLGGEISYPVADALALRGLPFIFVTGYDKEGVESRYAAVPLLQKPVDENSLRAVLDSCLMPPAAPPKTAAAV